MSSTELKRLHESLEKVWSSRTCYPSSARNWTSNNPALGQCAVTSLLVQEMFGGQIVFCAALNHFWNILPDGAEVDFTESQFTDQELKYKVIDRSCSIESLMSGDRALKARTKERLELLRSSI